MCDANKVWITELTLIHKNIRSVCNLHVQELTLMLKIICFQCDVKHILTSPKKTMKSVLKILTYIITSITVRSIRLAVMLTIMFVSTLITADFLYILSLSLSFFQVISLESWVNIMYYVQDAHSFWDWSYFVALIVVSIYLK